MRQRVGFPATLFYFTYAPFWETFWENLNFEIVYSPLTNKDIVDDGVRVTVTDACVPIKLYHGHVLALKEKVDYLFIPRLVSVEKRSTFCPKFLGLPDMIKASIDGLPEIIAPTIDIKNNIFTLWKVCKNLALQTGCKLTAAFGAYLNALRAHKNYLDLLYQGFFPLDAMSLRLKGSVPSPIKNQSANIAVLGYPYQIHDPYISVNLTNHLQNLDVRVWTMEMVPEYQLKTYARILPKNLFWYYSNRVIWSLYYYLEQPQIDGIIHVTAFGCGPDAMVDKLMELEMKKHLEVPFMSLTIDEHSGEAGIQTRLEAFVDMIAYRRKR